MEFTKKDLEKMDYKLHKGVRAVGVSMNNQVEMEL